MPRDRKPAGEHLRNGTFRPSRGHRLPNPEAAPPAPPPKKPATLRGEAARTWGWLVKVLGGSVRDRDAGLMERFCLDAAELKRVEVAMAGVEPGDKAYLPLLRSADKLADRVLKAGDRLGLNPRARVRLGLVEEAPKVQRVPTRPKTKLDLSGPPPGFEGEAS